MHFIGISDFFKLIEFLTALGLIVHFLDGDDIRIYSFNGRIKCSEIGDGRGGFIFTDVIGGYLQMRFILRENLVWHTAFLNGKYFITS